MKRIRIKLKINNIHKVYEILRYNDTITDDCMTGVLPKMSHPITNMAYDKAIGQVASYVKNVRLSPVRSTDVAGRVIDGPLLSKFYLKPV